MENATLQWGICWGYIGIIEKKMETTTSLGPGREALGSGYDNAMSHTPI